MQDVRGPDTVADLEPGAHVCCLYETEQEHRALLTPFLRRGLQQGQKILYISDAHDPQTILGYLRGDGLDVESCLESGQVTVLTADETYLREGTFDPDRMIARVAEEAERAVAEGYAALRVTGEMTWALRGQLGSDRLIDYEAKLNELFRGSKCLGLCQYDLRRFDPAVLLGVLGTHPLVVVGTTFCENPAYVAGAVRRGGGVSAAELRRWIEELREHARSAEALRETERRYRTIVEDMPALVCRFLPDGTLTFVNEAYCRYFGKKREELVGHDFFQFIPADGRAVVKEHYGCLSRDKPMVTYEHQVRAPDGTNRWQRWTDHALFDESGSLVEYQSIGEDITDRKRAEGALRRSREQLRALAARLQDIREEERTLLARRIHDDVGHALAAMKMDLAVLDRRIAEVGGVEQTVKMRDRIKSMHGLLDETIRTARETASDLRPGVLDDLGLAAALEWEARQFRTRTGIACAFVSSDGDLPLDRQQSTALYRICQELLTNVARHADATEARIDLREDEDQILLVVSDNGRGVMEQETSSSLSLGILGMRERAMVLGGHFDISGVRGRGTTATVRIPLRKKEPSNNK